MSINWPIKSEDIDEVINNLEKELTKKDIEIKQKNKVISELISSLEEHKIKSREVKAKLEYVKEEITKLENNLEKSISPSLFIITFSVSGKSIRSVNSLHPREYFSSSTNDGENNPPNLVTTVKLDPEI